MLVFFGLVIWIGLLFSVFGDLFRRHDISGWAKAGWCLLTIVLPIVGVLIYLGTQGSGMAERSADEGLPSTVRRVRAHDGRQRRRR